MRNLCYRIPFAPLHQDPRDATTSLRLSPDRKAALRAALETYRARLEQGMHRCREAL
jgi:hypothetical protein